MSFDKNDEFLLKEPLEWDYLSELARKQNLLPLFFECASQFEGYIKSEVGIKDQLDTFSIVASQIQRNCTFVEIYKKITEHGIWPVVLKGIVCRQLYGEMGDLRPSVDEDILVKVDDFWKIKEILEREHYVCNSTDITENVLNQIQEISFYNPEQKLNIEVHTNIIGKENYERVKVNELFFDVHDRFDMICIDGVDMKVLKPTDSLLFLIVHAFKHLQNRGVGIRQVIDILLYYREYKNDIDMDKLRDSLKLCEIENFWFDILYIGNQYLGLHEELPEQFCCPEELLQDMMRAGVFGGRDKVDFVAAYVNLTTTNGEHILGNVYTLYRTVFPPRQVLLGWYPFLYKKPWLLPVVWIKRVVRFVGYAKNDIWKVSKEIMQKSGARMKITRNYKK